MKYFTRIVVVVTTVLILQINVATQKCKCGPGSYGFEINCARQSLTTLANVLSDITCADATVMNIRDNNLTSLEFPEALFKGKTMDMLRADKNRIKNIDGLKDWKGGTLGLAMNQLSEIDLTIWGRTLVSIYVHGNSLTSLNMTNANKLRILWAQKNYLTNIVLPEKCALRHVYLQDNNLKSLSLKFKTCDKLRYLFVSNNYITTLPPVILSFLTMNFPRKPIIQINGNPIPYETVKTAFQLFITNHFSLNIKITDNCECSNVNSVSSSPVQICISSMCGRNAQNMWKKIIPRK